MPVAEARLAAHGGKFIAGGARPSCADFKCFTFFFASYLNPVTPTPVDIKAAVKAKVDANPHVKRWVEAMSSEEAAWIAARKPTF